MTIRGGSRTHLTVNIKNCKVSRKLLLIKVLFYGFFKKRKKEKNLLVGVQHFPLPPPFLIAINWKKNKMSHMGLQKDVTSK